MDDTFSKLEHEFNLKRLGISDYSELVGEYVYYSQDGYKFWSNPFCIITKKQ
jgi:hypothetical protein